MKRIIIIAVLLAVAIVGYTLYKRLDRRKVYANYLLSVGIPPAITAQMSDRELKAAFEYLKQYAKDGKHFTIDYPNYDLLSDMRIKYGIFT